MCPTRWLLVAVLLPGCSGGDDVDGPGTTPTPTDTPTPPPSPTGDTAPPAPTGDTAPPLPTYDCATMPARPVSITEMIGARGYHDVAFDDAGFIIGNGTGNFNLTKADYAGNSGVFTPTIGTVQQMVTLSDGDLAVGSDTHGIIRVHPNGGFEVLNSNIRPYGLIMGPDGLLWAADQDKVHKVDPITGDAQVVVPTGILDRGAPRVIAFNLDDTLLYIGTYSGTQGRIYQIPLDAAYAPTGRPTVFAEGVGSGAYHDAIGVDLCGNLYVPDYTASSLFRITPSGVVEEFLTSSGVFNREYVHGLEWGTGVGGWRTDAIYVTQPYDNNRVQEVVIGVPSRDWPGLALNRP